MKVLVTGAAGFIGSHLCRRLLEEGHEVIALDNFLSGTQVNIQDLRLSPNFHFHFASLDSFGVDCRFHFEDIDKVFHLAANMGGIGYISRVGADIMRDNLRMNLNFLEICRIRDIKDAVYSSSACVYPIEKQLSPEAVGLKEEDAYPANPDQFYGWEKLASEKLCEAYNRDYGLRIKILRYHNIYGPGSSWDEKAKAPMHLIKKAIDHPNPPFMIWGDGLQTRSFCYIDDAVEGTLRRMDSNYPHYLGPINIGSDRFISIHELARIIIGISGKQIIPLYDLTKPQGVRGRNADLTLARNILGWEPKISLEEGLRRTYQWALTQNLA